MKEEYLIQHYLKGWLVAFYTLLQPDVILCMQQLLPPSL